MSNKIKYHNFSLLINEKIVITKNNKEIKLNSVERNILSLLIQNPTVIFTKEEILKHSWREEMECHPSVVPQAISLLRKKMSLHNLEPIETVKGKGYKAAYLVPDKYPIKYSSLVLFVTIMSLIILDYPNLHLEQEKIKSFKFQEVNKQIVITSTSLPLNLKEVKLNDNVKYFINNQNNFISISACKFKDNRCTKIYNGIYFKEKSEPIDIRLLLSNIKFDKSQYLSLENKIQTFSLSAQVNLKALNSKNYNGKLYINFDVDKKNENNFYAKKTMYIKESGYSGGFGYASNNEITIIHNPDYDKLLIKKVDKNDLISLRFQFGIVKNSDMIYAYNMLSKSRNKYSYTYSYPISKNISYYYNDEMNISYIGYEHT
ncbi:winged helix family transcriptional regulator [Aliivibrio fischeri]|uniref:winged helix-turn-helix domain-containing protein n=1 Tax=Aliivibrio fischeri TaxID=668 RepID=UPI0012D85707|nr:winged helix-turn-helix domain-containing protein [Aliivibrio fischeri]MUK75734.1 winged helix family transcriptional regulator [Aliivibrio fischeri]